MAADTDKPIEIRFSGAMNSLNTPLDLYLRKQNEVVSMVNADLTYPGKLKLLRPLLALNATAGANIHSLCVADGVAYVVDGSSLKYLSGSTLTLLLALATSAGMSWSQVGDWLFIGNGADSFISGIEQRTGMAFRENQAVVVRMIGIVKIIFQMIGEQNAHQIGGAHH